LIYEGIIVIHSRYYHDQVQFNLQIMLIANAVFLWTIVVYTVDLEREFDDLVQHKITYYITVLLIGLLDILTIVDAKLLLPQGPFGTQQKYIPSSASVIVLENLNKCLWAETGPKLPIWIIVPFL